MVQQVFELYVKISKTIKKKKKTIRLWKCCGYYKTNIYIFLEVIQFYNVTW